MDKYGGLNKVESKKENCAISLIIISLLAISTTIFYRSSSHNSLEINNYCSIIPDDQYYSTTWHLSNIHANEAWEITTGSSNVSVAVIDSGIEDDFIDFQNNIDEQASIDCFSLTRGDPFSDPFCHGTCVATLLGAEGDNGYDFTGVSWNTKILSYRIDDDSMGHHADINAIINAIYYANYFNVPIVNLSIAFASSDFINNQFNYLQSYISSYSGLLVVSAGNNGHDLDSNNGQYALYPACFTDSNIICVGCFDTEGSTNRSNTGQQSVDLFAPGSNMQTYPFDIETGTIPCPFGGTSAAAPLVSGTAALMLSVNPSLTTAQLKSLILSNVDLVSSLANECVSGGKLNTYKAVKAAIPQITTFGSFVNGIQPLPSGKHQFYKISLTPGTYTFETSGNLYTSGYLYGDIQSSPIASSTNQSGNFSFTFSTIKNRVVYLKVVNNSSNTGTYSVKVASSHVHNYTFNYTWYNGYSHKAYCSCGQYQLLPHIADENHICVMCGGPYTGPLSSPLSNPNVIGHDSYVLADGTIILGNIDYSLYLLGQLDIDNLLRGLII